MLFVLLKTLNQLKFMNNIFIKRFLEMQDKMLNMLLDDDNTYSYTTNKRTYANAKAFCKEGRGMEWSVGLFARCGGCH